MVAPSVVPMAAESYRRVSARRAACRRGEAWLYQPGTPAAPSGSQLNWKGCMALIVIKCPKGGEDVPTGMATDRLAWDRLLPIWLGEPFLRPKCGEIHAWTKNDAWLEDLQL